jgi:hypothetical protein
MQDIYEEIANTINGVSPDSIREIINSSNEKKILYHGVKSSNSIEKIIQQGIKPLSPESRQCSFWSTGLRLFYPIDNDSTFFCWSGGYFSNNSSITELNLAITSYDLLSKKGIKLPKYKDDSHIKIWEIVPYETISLLSIKLKHQPTTEHIKLRKHRQRAEQMLLKSIDSQVNVMFSPGKIIPYFEEIK